VDRPKATLKASNRGVAANIDLLVLRSDACRRIVFIDGKTVGKLGSRPMHVLFSDATEVLNAKTVCQQLAQGALQVGPHPVWKHAACNHQLFKWRRTKVTADDIGHTKGTRLSPRSALAFGHANTRWLK
jgi:hypothetical protein